MQIFLQVEIDATFLYRADDRRLKRLLCVCGAMWIERPAGEHLGAVGMAAEG